MCFFQPYSSWLPPRVERRCLNGFYHQSNAFGSRRNQEAERNASIIGMRPQLQFEEHKRCLYLSPFVLSLESVWSALFDFNSIEVPGQAPSVSQPVKSYDYQMGPPSQTHFRWIPPSPQVLPLSQALHSKRLLLGKQAQMIGAPHFL